MSVVEIKKNDVAYTESEPTFYAKIDRKIIGSLTVYSEGDGWNLFYLQVDDQYQERGIAPQLLQAFIKEVSPGSPVSGRITHERTEIYLHECGIIKHARSGPVTLQNGLSDIPIVRTLTRGGIMVTEVVVEFDPLSSSPYECGIAFHGHT